MRYHRRPWGAGRQDPRVRRHRVGIPIRGARPAPVSGTSTASAGGRRSGRGVATRFPSSPTSPIRSRATPAAGAVRLDRRRRGAGRGGLVPAAARKQWRRVGPVAGGERAAGGRGGVGPAPRARGDAAGRGRCLRVHGPPDERRVQARRLRPVPARPLRREPHGRRPEDARSRSCRTPSRRSPRTPA